MKDKQLAVCEEKMAIRKWTPVKMSDLSQYQGGMF